MAEIETITLTVIGGPIRGVLQAVVREGTGAELADQLTQALRDIYPSVETHTTVDRGPEPPSAKQEASRG